MEQEREVEGPPKKLQKLTDSGQGYNEPNGVSTGMENEIRVPPKSLAATPVQYNICRHYLKSGTCSVGATCKFAHGEKELQVWNSSLGEKRLPCLSSPEIFRPPPGQGTLLKSPQTFALCSHFSRGTCHAGQTCKFAHGVEELNRWNQMTGKAILTPEQIAQQVQMNDEKGGRNKAIPKNRSKVSPPPQPVHPFSFMGGFPNPLASFGYGMPQVRSPPENVKATFQICNHQKKGHCSMGNTCKFAHSDIELQFWLSSQNKGMPQKQSPLIPQTQTVRPLPSIFFSNIHQQVALCPNIQTGSCPHGDICTFAHTLIEFQTWQLQQQCIFPALTQQQKQQQQKQSSVPFYFAQ